jgi:Ribbon-helix-helix protein, copG family
MKTKDRADWTRLTGGGPSSSGGDVEDTRDNADRLVRLSVNLGPQVADSLKEYAARKGVSITEAVRRAIAALAFIDNAQARGASVQVEEDGVRKEIVFLA